MLIILFIIKASSTDVLKSLLRIINTLFIILSWGSTDKIRLKKQQQRHCKRWLRFKWGLRHGKVTPVIKLWCYRIPYLSLLTCLQIHPVPYYIFYSYKRPCTHTLDSSVFENLAYLIQPKVPPCRGHVHIVIYVMFKVHKVHLHLIIVLNFVKLNI